MFGKFSTLQQIASSSKDPQVVRAAYRAYSRQQLALDTLLRLSNEQIALLGLNRRAVRDMKGLSN